MVLTRGILLSDYFGHYAVVQLHGYDEKDVSETDERQEIND